MSLNEVLEIIIEVFEYNILDQFAMLILGIEQVFDLNYVGTVLQHN